MKNHENHAAFFLCLHENRISPFNINVLQCHISPGARHAVPLPGDFVSANFMNMKLRFVNMKLRFHRSLCPLWR
jgi:hypothetical protein